MGINFSKHLITTFTATNFEQTKFFNMEVKIITVSCKADIFTDALFNRRNNALKVEYDSILLDFFYILKKSWIQCTLLYVKAYPVNLFRYIKLESVLLNQVYGQDKVFHISPHNSND